MTDHLTPYTIAMLLLLAFMLATGVVLRVIAMFVQQYATHLGTPHLALAVRIAGLCFLALGFIVSFPGAIVLLSHPAEYAEVATGTAAVLVAFDLLLCGGFAWWWGRRLGSAGRNESIEVGVRWTIGLFYASWTLAIGLCIAAAFQPLVTLAGVPILILTMVLQAMIDILLAWFRRMHERYWNLWQIYLAVRSRQPLAGEVDILSQYSWGGQRRRLIYACEQLREGVDSEFVFVRATRLSSLEGAQIATGLRARRLSTVLNDILTRQNRFAGELHHNHNPMVAILYLWVVVTVMAAVVAFISYYIVPKMKKIFDDFGTMLPEATRMAVRATDYSMNYWYLTFPPVIILLTLLSGLAILPFSAGLSGFRERLARWWPRICLPDLLRSLALAIRSNVPVEEAFVPFVRRQFPVALHNKLVRVQETIRDGGDCWIGMADEKLLSPAEAQLLRSAERAGNLSWALDALGARCEQRWEFFRLFWFEFLQPAVVIAIGAMTAFFAISYFLPLVKLLNDLS